MARMIEGWDLSDAREGEQEGEGARGSERERESESESESERGRENQPLCVEEVEENRWPHPSPGREYNGIRPRLKTVRRSPPVGTCRFHPPQFPTPPSIPRVALMA